MFSNSIIVLGVKHFLEKLSASRDGPEKVQKQGRDENTKRLSCCRKVIVKEDWKTTLLVLQKLSRATEVE